ncbi:zinc ribbon domain-containing protein [Methyloceanibacter sp. wino2]|uniref:zinc ribbon domain-containing protein n=1 Tax=Methyloceanibacter sp. wino2 TaxID=2170729 RepID=UPI000D3EDE01|nr:zinc ribbon domain-containing protein [Methyloceanibacter sp. wino2]
MAHVCPSCNAPLADDDKFCSECGRELDAFLELPDGSRPVARRPNLYRDAIVFFLLAAISTLVADFIEVNLALRATWDITSTPSLYLVYSLLAMGVFVILYILWGRIFRGAGAHYSGRRLLVQLICLGLGMAVLFYGPITDAIYDLTDPEGPIWVQFDLLNALLAALLYAAYLAFTLRRAD